MVHQPFEDWLLNDEQLTPNQERDLRLHLRDCLACTALARGNLTLRSAPVTSPPDGFAPRFQARLAAERKIQRSRSLIGLILLAVVGTGGLVWLLFPYFPYLTLSPAQLLSMWMSNLIYLGLTVRAMGALGNTLLNVISALIPPYAWLLSVVLLGGIGLLWAFSLRRVGKFVQSAA